MNEIGRKSGNESGVSITKMAEFRVRFYAEFEKMSDFLNFEEFRNSGVFRRVGGGKILISRGPCWRSGGVPART